MLKEFTEGLGRLRYVIDWVLREAEKTWPQLRDEYREWVIIACDGRATAQGWCAPGWLAGWPTEIALPTTALWERLDANSTAEVLRMVAAEVQGRLHEAQRMALNHARVLIAQEKEVAHGAANGEALPKGEQPERPQKLPEKKQDLSNYFDGANLTDLQRKVISLKLEYELSVTEISTRLQRHRSTVQEILDAANRKIAASGAKEGRAKKRAERNPGTLE